MQSSPHALSRVRARATLRGVVQGVGFRPFVFRLATELRLDGWVNNSPQGVTVEIEGPSEIVQSFLLRLPAEAPPRAAIQSSETTFLDPVGHTTFAIRESDTTGRKTTLVLPDIATCADCRREVFDPANRRHRYPFTNCTHCGPRFSIIEALPYDRAHTTMRRFAMCPVCQAEYDDPADRRFHAQPNACPVCGPQLALWSPAGAVLAQQDDALRQAEAALMAGQIVAIKGLGGFHLMVDARNFTAVQRLRQRKQREEKPFALMFPSLAKVAEVCDVTPPEVRLLQSPESPIVLLRRQADGGLAAEVAPGNPYLGVMLPYTPLHHLLLADLDFPLVATSGNLSDEPICTDEQEALARLRGIADFLLVHNRPITRHVDDSIVRMMLGRELVMRRARGYAPLPITVRATLPPTLAVGAHLKNTVALVVDNQIFLSQHIGDLETPEARGAFQRVAGDLQQLFEQPAQQVACDLHPDYSSTRHAVKTGLPVRAVQHHAAHVAACMAENELEGPVLGVSWDGTGLGADNTIWGGEFIWMRGTEWRRVGHLRRFPLPGGEAAVKEPRRSALGALFAMYGEEVFAMRSLPLLKAFTTTELATLHTMLARHVNCPLTSSAGRLFDAAAALAGLRQITHFEGQSAMELEWAADDGESEPYPFVLKEIGGQFVVDWALMLETILTDRRRNVPVAQIAAKFHATLVEIIVAVAQRMGETSIVLSGGCFQNRRLTEGAVTRLRAVGRRPYWHQRVPPNDGGIALGQIILCGDITKEQHHVSSGSR